MEILRKTNDFSIFFLKNWRVKREIFFAQSLIIILSESFTRKVSDLFSIRGFMLIFWNFHYFGKINLARVSVYFFLILSDIRQSS
jgi:hypothetical protein